MKKRFHLVRGRLTPLFVMASVWVALYQPPSLVGAQDTEQELDQGENSTPVVRLIPPDLEMTEGVATADLRLEGGPSASSITIWLHFDSDRFALTSIDRGDLLSASGAELAHEIEDGDLTLLATFPVPEEGATNEDVIPLGDGLIARLGLAALEEGGGEITIDRIEIRDADGASLNADSQGTVTIEASAVQEEEGLLEAVAQATALAEASVPDGLLSSPGRGIFRAITRSAQDLGPFAAWIALLVTAAGVTALSWFLGREDIVNEMSWTAENSPDEHRGSML